LQIGNPWIRQSINKIRTWNLINQDPDYCWGIFHIFETEVGSFSKSELVNFRGKFGLGIERDLYFEEVGAKEFYESLFNVKKG